MVATFEEIVNSIVGSTPNSHADKLVIMSVHCNLSNCNVLDRVVVPKDQKIFNRRFFLSGSMATKFAVMPLYDCVVDIGKDFDFVIVTSDRQIVARSVKSLGLIVRIHHDIARIVR